MDETPGAVIIRDDTGTEHEFPAGFDPKRAAAIVRQRTSPQGPAPVERGGLSHPLTSVAAPELEAVRGKLNTATETPHGQPYMARSRTGALYPSETGTGIVDAAKNVARGFGGELINQAEGVTSPLGIATIGAGAGASKLAQSPQARGVIGRTLRMVSDFDVTHPLKSTLGQVSGALERSAVVPQAVQDAQMGVTRGAEMYQMPRAQTVVDRAPRAAQMIGDVPSSAVAADAPAAAAGLSDAERAALTKQGFAPDVIAKIEQQAAQQPTRGTLRMAPQTPPVTVDTASLPESWKPLAEPSPMQQPRVQVGAEKVGRGVGLTKEEVRQQTAPILGEAPGEASPILPETTLKRIIDTIKDLPKSGPEREAYVAKATSGKTQWQVENIRRTLEHLGLIVPVAAGAGMGLREAVRQRLTGPVTGQ